MNTRQFPVKTAITVLALIQMVACSSTNNLRRFKEDNIQKEIPVEIARKFEIKDAGQAKASPTPEKAAAKKVEKKPKKKKDAQVDRSKNAPFVIPVRKLDPMPFNVGEKLSYDIRYVGVTAGTILLELMPFKEVNERKVYQIHALAKTVKLFELVYRVNDQIDSYWDAEGLFSHRFTMDLDESKQSRKVIEFYDYEKKRSYYWNRVDHVEKGFKEQKEEFDIQLWAQDPISALYYLRIADLPKEAGKEHRFPIVVDGKPWEGVVKFVGREKIYAGGKYFEANAYSLENYQNNELKNKDNKIWISDDEHRYILRVEAKIKVGSFAVALDKIL